MLFAPGGYYDEPLSPVGGGGGSGDGGLDLPVRSFTTEYEDECVSVSHFSWKMVNLPTFELKNEIFSGPSETTPTTQPCERSASPVPTPRASAAPPPLSAAPPLEKPRSSLSRDENSSNRYLAATELAAADASSFPLPSSSSPSALPFVVRVCGAPDTRGTLHALVDALWAADLTVYRAEAGFAHGATAGIAAGGRKGTGGRTSPPRPRFVADSFWALDNTGELPDPNRVAEVRAAVREALEKQQRKEEKEQQRQPASSPSSSTTAAPATPTKTSVVAVPVLRTEATCTIAPAALDDVDDDGDFGSRRGSSMLESGLGGPSLTSRARGGAGGGASHRTPPAVALASSSTQASPPRSFPPERRNCVNSAAAVPLRDAAAQRRRAAAAAKGSGSGSLCSLGSLGGGKASPPPEKGRGHLLQAEAAEGEQQQQAASYEKAASSAAGSGEEEEGEEEERIATIGKRHENKPGGGGGGGCEESDDEEGEGSDFDEFAWDDAVAVDLDNTTARSYSVVSVTCADRKGLIYDLMRTLKDVAVRVAYARVSVDDATGLADVDLFVSDANNASSSCGSGYNNKGVGGDGSHHLHFFGGAVPCSSAVTVAGGGAGGFFGSAAAAADEDEGGRVEDRDLAEELLERVREAATLPLRIRLKKKKSKEKREVLPSSASAAAISSSSTFTDEAELTVVGPLDSGGRGRPRVTADVTAALASLGLDVVSADVYVEGGGVGGGGVRGGAGSDSDGGGENRKRRRASREVHRFVLSSRGSELAGASSSSSSPRAPAPLRTHDQRRAVYDCVRAELCGGKRRGGVPQQQEQEGEKEAPPPPAFSSSSPPLQQQQQQQQAAQLLITSSSARPQPASSVRQLAAGWRWSG